MKDFMDRLLFLVAYPMIALFSFLPPAWAVGIGKWLGRIAFCVDARHRHISLTNLQAAFPDLSASERRVIARKAFENLGKTLLEIPGLARQKPEDIQRRVRYVGPDREEWIRVQQEGGALLLTGHIGNWELMALGFGWQEETKLAFVARPLDNPYFDRWMNRLRSRSGNRIIPKKGALRGIRGALREGLFVGLLMDQGTTGRDGVFVDFFGHLAGSNVALAFLAGRFGVPVCPVYIIRDASGTGHTVHIGPEVVPLVRTGRKKNDIVENTQRIQKALEEIIRQHPEQWFWMHRRWKGSPTVSYEKRKSEFVHRRRKAVFLDRDGTLIRERGYLKDPAQVELEQGAAEAVARLNRIGFAVVLVTNQSGVARGYFTEEDVASVHETVERLLEAEGARLDGLYYCPHYPEGVVQEYRRACTCRKPAGGMLLQAAADLGIRLEGSYMIGDKLTDADAARREGLTGILVRTGYGENEWRACLQGPEPEKPDRVVLDLKEAVDFVCWAEKNLVLAGSEGKEGEGIPWLWSTKWISLAFLEKCLVAHRKQGQTIVLANGVFDLLHAGHVGCLQAARALGDVLVVALSDDRSVREQKGVGRPVLPVEERVEILSALDCVDYCVVYWERKVDRLLGFLRPDVFAKGTDCEEAFAPEGEAVVRYGGQVRIVGPREGWATTHLLERIKTLHERCENGD
jgi:rfaE bifunctional protein nucleotidyltransferase chain/domain